MVHSNLLAVVLETNLYHREQSADTLRQKIERQKNIFYT